MGCVGAKARHVHEENERRLAKDAEADKKTYKILLLGAGESGKSTLFKQLTTIYGTGFTDLQRRQCREIVQQNVVTSIDRLITQAQLMHEALAYVQKHPGAVGTAPAAAASSSDAGRASPDAAAAAAAHVPAELYLALARNSPIPPFNAETLAAVPTIRAAASSVSFFSSSATGGAAASAAAAAAPEGSTDPLTAAVVKAVATCWRDSAIQFAYEHRNLFFLIDCAGYFISRAAEVLTPTYMPNNEAIYRARRTTSGIVSSNFNVHGRVFSMYDVGGQRSERRKWLVCFENVHAVIFVVSLCGYCQVCCEDESQNRLVEDLTLFEQVISNELFKHTTIILFLNKVDIFSEVIQKHPLSDCFPEYKGAPGMEAGLTFIRQQFESACARRCGPTKPLWVHVTNALDTLQVETTLQAVSEVIFGDMLAKVESAVGAGDFDKDWRA